MCRGHARRIRVFCFRRSANALAKASERGSGIYRCTGAVMADVGGVVDGLRTRRRLVGRLWLVVRIHGVMLYINGRAIDMSDCERRAMGLAMRISSTGCAKRETRRNGWLVFSGWRRVKLEAGRADFRWSRGGRTWVLKNEKAGAECWAGSG